MEHFKEKFAGNLLNTAFAGHTFEDCAFEKCDFKEISLTNTRFISCTFVACDLSNVALSNARFRDTSFEMCKLLGVQWVQLADFVNPSFKECNLNYCNFVGLKLKKTLFLKCSLRDADFSQTDLSESDFRGSDFLNARFHSTILLKANFQGALDYVIDPTANKVRGARFSLPEAQGLLMGLGIIIN